MVEGPFEVSLSTTTLQLTQGDSEEENHRAVLMTRARSKGVHTARPKVARADGGN